MSALIELPLETEILSLAELEEITGCKSSRLQIEWLKDNGWIFHTTRRGDPVVGRLYVRLKLAGISMQSLITAQEFNEPNFSALRKRSTPKL